jgi:tetratricopeptide (TPR) repeat protein
MTTFYEIAVAFVSRSRYDLAEVQLRRSLGTNPEHAASHALLAICLARLQKPREALAAANEGLRLDPTLPFAHYARASVHSIAKRSRPAKTDIEEAIRLDPTSPNQFFLLSAIESDLGRVRESLTQAERGLQFDPNHTGCLSLRALSLQRLGRKREAEAAIAQALMLGADDDFTHTAQGWRLLQKHDPNGARKHFSEALRINPQNRWAEGGLRSSKAHVASHGYLLVALGLGMLRLLATLASGTDRAAIAAAVIVGLGIATIAAGCLWIRDRLQESSK